MVLKDCLLLRPELYTLQMKKWTGNEIGLLLAQGGVKAGR